MKPFYQDIHVTVYKGDCRTMKELPDDFVQCVTTSPPYWGLRKYAGDQDLIWDGDPSCVHEWGEAVETGDNRFRGENALVALNKNEEAWAGGKMLSRFCRKCGAWRGAFGHEPLPEMYVDHTVQILREIRRVLRPDGVVFWNIGDSYAGSGKGLSSDHGKSVFTDDDIPRTSWGKHDYPFRDSPVIPLKSKDLCLIPFRVALEAQRDGWWIRSVIIWDKANPMPESARDRPTESHEYIIMMTKSKNYYWDQEAVREEYTEPLDRWGGDNLKANGHSTWDQGTGQTFYRDRNMLPNEAGRNIRSVWKFATQPYPEAHFAVFPEKLPEICIKAATPEMGSCPKCGKPWTRVIEKGFTLHDGQTNGGKDDNSKRIAMLRQAARERGGEYVNETKTVGWEAGCECNTVKPPVPAVVLDPFAGSGTVLWVAKKLNRKAVAYEISEEYCRLIRQRNQQQVGL